MVLPEQLRITGGQSDWTELAENYDEFALNPHVDAKVFELTKRRDEPQPGSK